MDKGKNDKSAYQLELWKSQKDMDDNKRKITNFSCFGSHEREIKQTKAKIKSIDGSSLKFEYHIREVKKPVKWF